jgi:hypothetical protein
MVPEHSRSNAGSLTGLDGNVPRTGFAEPFDALVNEGDGDVLVRGASADRNPAKQRRGELARVFRRCASGISGRCRRCSIRAVRFAPMPRAGDVPHASRATCISRRRAGRRMGARRVRARFLVHHRGRSHHRNRLVGDPATLEGVMVE